MQRILITLVGAAALTLAIAAPSGAKETIYAPRDCSKPRVEPKSITLTCGDAQTVLKHLHWEDWNLPKVRGEGQLWVNDCDPNCAEGTIEKFEAKVRLLNPQTYTCGGQTLQMYRRIHLRFPDEAPPHQNSLRSFKLDCV